MKTERLLFTASWLLLYLFDTPSAWAIPKYAFFPSNTSDRASTSPTHPAFLITGSVISGPPDGSKPVRGSKVKIYLAAIAGNRVFKVHSVKTDSKGAFTMKFGNTPNPQAILYLVASGGSVGGNGNAAISMMSVLGLPPSSGNSITATVNELTTVAAAYALSSFIQNRTQIVDNSVNFLTHAVVNTLPYLASINGTITDNDPYKRNTLANALANCVEGTAKSTECRNLFLAANAPSTPKDTLGAITNINKSPANNVEQIFSLGKTGPFKPVTSEMPTDWTLALVYGSVVGTTPTVSYGFAINSSGKITGNQNQLNPPTPAGTVGGVAYDSSDNGWHTFPAANQVIEGSSPPFADGGLNDPQALAFDPMGNVWITNHILAEGSVSELDSMGNPIALEGYFAGGVGNNPAGIAVDVAGNVWVAANTDVAELVGGSTPQLECSSTPLVGDTGCPISPPDGYTDGGLNGAQGVAVDSAGNVWVANSTGDSVTELKGGSTPDLSDGILICSSPPIDGQTGCPVSPTSGYTGGGLSGPQGIAIDGDDNIWVANFNGQSVTELTGGSTPPVSCPKSAPKTGDTGCAVSPASGYTGGGTGAADGIAIDAAGDVWVSNPTTTSFTEFVGAAAPVITPVVKCLIFEKEHPGLTCKP